MPTDFYARELACKSIEQSYNPTIATVSQKQEYADCIDMLYPQTPSVDVFSTKLIIAFVFLFFILHTLYAYKNKSKFDNSVIVIIMMSVIVTSAVTALVLVFCHLVNFLIFA